MAAYKSWKHVAHCTSYRQLNRSENILLSCTIDVATFQGTQVVSVSCIHLSCSVLCPGCFPCLSVSELLLLFIHPWERMDLVNLVSYRDSLKPLDCLLPEHGELLQRKKCFTSPVAPCV